MNYPARALRAIAHLFRPYNDIDVYVEDEKSRRVYELLLQQYLGDRARVSRVLSVGSRQAVLDECAKDQAPGGHPRLYLIDGDYDHALGAPEPELARLYRLRCYTLENLLWCAKAAAHVGADCLGDVSTEDAKAILDLEKFLDVMVERLRELMVRYLAVQLLAPDLQTSGRNVLGLCVHRAGCPSLAPSKVAKLVADLDAELGNRVGPAKLAKALDFARAQLPASTDELAHCIPGKTHLLPLLYHRLRRRAGLNDTLEQLKVRLARSMASILEPGLQEALLSAARG